MRKGITLTLQALLGLFMAFTAYTFYGPAPEAVTRARDALNLPDWYMMLAGVLAVISAIALLVGLFVPVLGAFAALWTTAYFIVATISHLARGDRVNYYVPLTFLVLFAILVWLRWDDARPIRGVVGMA